MTSTIRTRCGLITLLLMTTILIIFGIIIEHHYLTKYETGTCMINECQSIPGTCWSCGNIKCSNYITVGCKYLLYNYTLDINGETYIKKNTLLAQTCPETIVCYYLAENIESSLIDDPTLKGSSSLETILIKIVHVLVYFVPIGWILFGGYVIWFEILPSETRLNSVVPEITNYDVNGSAGEPIGL